jgi:hypothetical protein
MTLLAGELQNFLRNNRVTISIDYNPTGATDNRWYVSLRTSSEARTTWGPTAEIAIKRALKNYHDRPF